MKLHSNVCMINTGGNLMVFTSSNVGSIGPGGAYDTRSRGWWDGRRHHHNNYFLHVCLSLCGCCGGVRTHLTELFLIHHLWLRSLWQDIIIHIAAPPPQHLQHLPSVLVYCRVTVWISPTTRTASETVWCSSMLADWICCSSFTRLNISRE